MNIINSELFDSVPQFELEIGSNWKVLSPVPTLTLFT